MTTRCQSEALVACVVVGVLAGCSSEGNILPKRERFTPSVLDAGEQDVAPDVTSDDSTPDVESDSKKPRDPQANCVKPGTPNNERGVGGYCESGPVDCIYEAGPRFCTADFKEVTAVPEYQWFCSTVCTTDDECGTGAFCYANDFAHGCVPEICRPDGGAHPVKAPAGKAPWP
jgi:hypothetical protein